MNELEQKKIFSENLNHFLEIHNKTQREVAAAISVSPQTFNTWCKGIALPRMGKVQKLADYFHISKADLIDTPSDLTQIQKNSNIILVPVYRTLAGDISHIFTEHADFTEPVRSFGPPVEELFGVEVQDNSMEPKFSCHDIAIARRQNDAKNNDIVIALVDGQPHPQIRCLKKYANGIALLASNPSYDPIYHFHGESTTPSIQIIGKIKELHSRL